MPKILLGVSHSFCANFLAGQVNFLVEHGYDVIIISGPGEEISMLAKKENARLITIPFSPSISPLTDFIHLLTIMRILKKEKPDIVNAGNPKSGMLIMLACWLVGLKNRIFTLHGLVSDTKTNFSRWIISQTEKISCRIAKLVLVVSPSLKEHAERRKILPVNKGIVIENGSCNGVDVNVFSKTDALIMQAKKLKEHIGLNEDDIVIGFVGRLSKDKGIDILFKAFKILVKKHQHIKLVLAGPVWKGDPLTPSSMHELYFNNNIFYLGKLIDIVPVYGLINLLVLPSLREGFGNVLIEASAMQVPVIASRIPGCKDAVRENVNGYLFEKGDADELANLIEKLIINKNLRNSLGEKGRKFVQTNFSNIKIWQRQLSLYNHLINDAVSK